MRLKLNVYPCSDTSLVIIGWPSFKYNFLFSSVYLMLTVVKMVYQFKSICHVVENGALMIKPFCHLDL